MARIPRGQPVTISILARERYPQGVLQGSHRRPLYVTTKKRAPAFLQGPWSISKRISVRGESRIEQKYYERSWGGPPREAGSATVHSRIAG